MPPTRRRARASLCDDGIEGGVVHCVRRRAPGRCADDDCPGTGKLLQPCGRVDDVAGHGRLATRRIGGEVEEHLSRRDADSHSQLEAAFRLVHLLDLAPCRKCRPQRALGVVLVRERGPKDPENRIADELLDRASESLELGANTAVVRREQAADVFRVELLCEVRVADEVDEEHCDDPSFRGHARLRVIEPETAGRAEPAPWRILLAAPGTSGHVRKVWHGRARYAIARLVSVVRLGHPGRQEGPLLAQHLAGDHEPLNSAGEPMVPPRAPSFKPSFERRWALPSKARQRFERRRASRRRRARTRATPAASRGRSRAAGSPACPRRSA